MAVALAPIRALPWKSRCSPVMSTTASVTSRVVPRMVRSPVTSREPAPAARRPRGPKGDRRVLLGVEEVGAAEVRVARRVARVDGRGGDGDDDRGGLHGRSARRSPRPRSRSGTTPRTIGDHQVSHAGSRPPCARGRGSTSSSPSRRWSFSCAEDAPPRRRASRRSRRRSPLPATQRRERRAPSPNRKRLGVGDRGASRRRGLVAPTLRRALPLREWRAPCATPTSGSGSLMSDGQAPRRDGIVQEQQKCRQVQRRVHRLRRRVASSSRRRSRAWDQSGSTGTLFTGSGAGQTSLTISPMNPSLVVPRSDPRCPRRRSPPPYEGGQEDHRVMVRRPRRDRHHRSGERRVHAHRQRGRRRHRDGGGAARSRRRRGSRCRSRAPRTARSPATTPR